jgi:hypothetical protein
MIRGVVRVTVTTLAAVMMTIGLMVATTNMAHAGLVQIWDDVEGATPWTRWQGGGDGDGVAGYDINGGVALSGKNNGWLYVSNGWAANRIPVNLDGGFSGRKSSCAAAVSVNVLAPGAQVGLQIWNPNGWTIIASVDCRNGTGYHQIVIDNLNLTNFSGTIYLQVIYGNNDNVKKFIRFDDMVLQCFSEALRKCG